MNNDAQQATGSKEPSGNLSTARQHDQTSAARDEISPQREKALLDAMLRYQVGIDPDRLGSVLDLAAIGIVNSGWRNGPVEDWHAGDGPLSDGDMLRVNAHTTWRIREIARRWRTDLSLTAQSPIAALDALETDDVNWLAARIFRWLINPSRRLPTAVKLVDLAGDDLGEFTEHVNGTLGSFAATAERRGARYALYQAAAHGGLACPHWWGHTNLAGTRPHLRSHPGRLRPFALGTRRILEDPAFTRTSAGSGPQPSPANPPRPALGS
ncbi:hypothetical protein [Dactylosporangium sp. NPDC050588]|uniref:hypothetical protein n=1 Tax=Dactylosporangium sp. NPDC050588 TaxID=3157211 RepID=UPI0033D36BE1